MGAVGEDIVGGGCGRGTVRRGNLGEEIGWTGSQFESNDVEEIEA